MKIIMNLLKKGIIVIIGFGVALVCYSISVTACESIMELSNGRGILRIILLDNDATIYQYIDKSNYLLYLPTFIFFYVAIVCTNQSLFSCSSNALQMQMLRFGSMKHWFLYRIRYIAIDNFLYIVGFGVGCICLPDISIDSKLFFCVTLRMIWCLVFSCLIIYVTRRKSLSAGVFVAFFASVIIIIVDESLSNVSLISYSFDMKAIVIGIWCTAIVSILCFFMVVHKIYKKEVL